MGLSSVRVLGMACVVAVGVFATCADATITGTNVSVGMRIDLQTSQTEISGTDVGTTYAEVDFTGPSTGARVSSLLHIDSLSSEAANLRFHLSYNGNDSPDVRYMGVSGPGPNIAEILYHAEIDVEMLYAWDFDYLGPEPFGLQSIHVKENGITIATLGDFGKIGHHEGADTFNLLSGNDYIVEVWFNPNAGGTGVGEISGALVGDISFVFVPEPTTLALLGLGSLGLLRRRKS
jgi:hypothetical protein